MGGGGGGVEHIIYCTGFVRGFFCWCGGVIDCMCNWYPKLLRKHDIGEYHTALDSGGASQVVQPGIRA